MNRICPLIASGLVFLVGHAFGQIPHELYYESFYEPDGNISLVIRIYTNATGGDYLYQDSNTVAVTNGAFSTRIGDDTTYGTLTNALASGHAFLDVTINGTTLTNREQILPEAYALKAASVPNDAITASMIADNAIQSRHLAVTGTLHATSFVGDGSGLTGIEETDPIWNAEKSNYATGAPLYVESDTLQSVTARGGLTTSELKRVTSGFVVLTNNIVINGAPVDLSAWETNIPPPGAGNYYPWAVQPANSRFLYFGYNSGAKLVQYRVLATGVTYRLSLDNLTLSGNASLIFGVLNDSYLQLTDFNTGGVHLTYEWVQSAPATGFWFGVHAHNSPRWDISFSNVSILVEEIVPASFTNSFLTDSIGNGSQLTNLSAANLTGSVPPNSLTNAVEVLGLATKAQSDQSYVGATEVFVTNVSYQLTQYDFAQYPYTGGGGVVASNASWATNTGWASGYNFDSIAIALTNYLATTGAVYRVTSKGYRTSTAPSSFKMVIGPCTSLWNMTDAANILCTNTVYYTNTCPTAYVVYRVGSYYGYPHILSVAVERMEQRDGTFVLAPNTSVAATGFIGNGSGLTNLNISSDTNYVRRAGDTMTGCLSNQYAYGSAIAFMESADAYSFYQPTIEFVPRMVSGGRMTNYLTFGAVLASGVTNRFFFTTTTPGLSRPSPFAVGDPIQKYDAVNINYANDNYLGIAGNGFGLTNLNISSDTNFVRRTGDTMTGTLTLNAVTALTTTGNVGIGTTPTTNRLEVAGAAQVTAIRVVGTSGSYIERQGDISMGVYTNGL